MTPGHSVRRYLMEALALGKSRDFKAFTNLILETKDEEDIAQIMISDSEEQEETPSEGNTKLIKAFFV